MKVSKSNNGWTLAMIACVFVFSFTACNNENKQPAVDDSITEEPVVEAPVQVVDDTHKLTERQIASAAVAANRVDVNYGNIALNKSKNADVRKFAETMVKDHEGIIKTATDLVTKLGMTADDNNFLTTSLVNGEKETIQKLNALSGAEFDKAYIANEVTYHEAVISAVKDVLIPQSINSELKSTLQSIVPLLEHHLEMAKMAQKNINK